MKITMIELSQMIDATIENETYAANVADIVEGLCELGMDKYGFELDCLWDDIHPETLEGMETFVKFLEETNDVAYIATLMDPRSMNYPGGPKSLPNDGAPIKFRR